MLGWGGRSGSDGWLWTRRWNAPWSINRSKEFPFVNVLYGLKFQIYFSLYKRISIADSSFKIIFLFLEMQWFFRWSSIKNRSSLFRHVCKFCILLCKWCDRSIGRRFYTRKRLYFDRSLWIWRQIGKWSLLFIWECSWGRKHNFDFGMTMIAILNAFTG